ncbi:hypothetical protein VNO77_37460 [Canavalia gladiata]|uniref:RING-type E3 ubiquitin transferase n=1 Tax=Canavalia gladiata TaxID=3824 RepID=A0AAN9KA34_CANGL
MGKQNSVLVNTVDFVFTSDFSAAERFIQRALKINRVITLFLECKPKVGKRGNRTPRKCLVLYGKLMDEGLALHQWWGNTANLLDSHYVLDACDNVQAINQYNQYYSGMNHSSGPYVPLDRRASGRNCHYFNTLADSSVASSSARHVENSIPLQSNRRFNRRFRSSSDGSIMVHNDIHSIRGNYLRQHLQPVAPPWLDQRLNRNNNDGHALFWNQSLPMPYVQAPNVNGTSLENMDLQRRHYGTARRRYDLRFRRTHFVNNSPSFHYQSQPLREMRVYPIPINQPHRGNVYGTTLRHRDFPPTTFPQFDHIVLIVDHHRDMRMNTQNMSHEGLPALGEQIENATLIEEMITRHMKTKIYSLPTNATNLEKSAYDEQEIDSCVICQDEYNDQDKIGVLKCGHEYHEECLRKWLLEKNICPMCRSEALTFA